jgi:hypothetical protein
VTSKTVPSYGFFFQEVMIITIIRAANKKLQQIQNESLGERILILTTLILQVRIASVVVRFLQAWSTYNGNEHVKQKTKNENENSHEIKYDLHSFHNVGLWLENYIA